jgi:HlyD family secretion protein
MKKLIVRLLVLLTVAGMVAGGYYLVQQIPEEEDGAELALIPVERGDLTVRTYLRGELRAVRSLTLTAPNLGSQSQVIQLAPAGALAQRGNLIVELDDSERVAALEDDLLSVEKIEQQLVQAETELKIQKSQDEVELTRANFQVRRWELESRRNELLSSIDARKNELSLEEAKRRKAKLEEDIKNRLAQQEAQLAVLREQLKKAQLDVDRERKRIEEARVLAPISGLVSILENRSGGRGGFGTATPAIREGDQIPPGLAVAQLLDLSEMELVAKVEEVERANLREGQEALLRLDALPGKVVTGKIKRLGTTASMNIFRGEATKKFDCIVSIDMRQLLENVGASPEQIRRILATAEQNAAQGFGAAVAGPGGGPGSPGAGRRPRGAGGASGGNGGGAPGAAAGPGGQGGGGGAPGGGRRQMTPEMQEQLKQLSGGKELSELSQEERRAIFQKMRAQAGAAGGQAAAGGPGGRPGRVGGFTLEQRKNAVLPSPPEKGSDVDILLRPGLLADAEVIVQEIKDVVYVPYQAIFDSPQGDIVYLWRNDRLEPRKVSVGARSESQVVISEGLEEGDLISLQAPDGADSGRDRKKNKKASGKSGGSPGGGFGGAPGGGGRRGGGGN